MGDMTVIEFLSKSKETLNLIEPFKGSNRNGKGIDICFSSSSCRNMEFHINIRSNSFSGYCFDDSSIRSMYIKDCLKDSIPISIANCTFKSASIVVAKELDELNGLFIVFDIPK